MARSLRSWLAKLKNGKKGRSQRQLPEQNQTHESTQELSSKMADLDLTSPAVAANEILPAMPVFKPYKFGTENDPVDFTFELLPGYKHWPGPPYDKGRSYAPGTFDQPRKPKPKTKSRPKRELSSYDGRRSSCRQKESSSEKAVRTVTRAKKPVQRIPYYSSASTRQPPANFLGLPGEIRNQIYRILCIREDPIVAGFRPTYNVKRLATGGRQRVDTIRRYPREPVLALTCHQIQKEVLSIFYGENEFIFRESTHPELRIMTNPDAISAWKPRSNFTNALRHIELQFNAKSWFSLGKQPLKVIYTLSKLARARLCATVDAEWSGSCICLEERVLQDLVATFVEGSQDLLEAAMKLVTSRRDRLVDLDCLVKDDKFFPDGHKCNECGLRPLREVASGL